MSDQAAKIEKTLQELEELREKRSELWSRELQLEEKLRKRLKPVLDRVRPPPLNAGAQAWRAQLLDMAQRDLRAAQVLVRDMDKHAATMAMLLQMVFEKLAKAHLAQTDWSAFVAHRHSHAVANKFAHFLKGNRNLLPKVGPHSDKVLLWVTALTSAHPAIAKNGPHLEYPWERVDDDEGHRVCSPSRDLPIVNELGDPLSGAGPHLVKFAAHFIENFDDIFS